MINNNQAIFEEEKVKLKQNIDDLNLILEKNIIEEKQYKKFEPINV
ncbi:hypothetical protein H8J86_08490 [Clostridium perfringens]|nr:hypothetical protein [Clostridium perfringens]MBI6005992.1 hypothetical protein [Clostridium perfringens]